MKNINIPNWATYGILIIAAFLFVFLFSCTTSPLYEHYPFWFHGDSGIFQEMGICLLQGGTPYVDLFDHKGPILWFIQALGIWINPHWGLMALQSVFLFCSMLLWYETTFLIVDKQLHSIITTLFGLFFLLAFYERGNLCEEWSLLFISIPIYIFFKRWKNAKENGPIYTHVDSLILGLCVGVIAMIRLNNTAPLIVFAILHLIRCIKGKEYKWFWTDVAIICGGVICVIFLCSIFYFVKEGWTGVYEMIYGSIIYNYLYLIGDVGSRLPFIIKLQHYAPSIGFIIISIIICHFTPKKQLIVATIISYIVSLLAIGRFGYGHYMIILIPLFVITIGVIYMHRTFLTGILFVFTVITTIRLLHDPADRLVVNLLRKPINTELYDGFHRFVNSIPEKQRHNIYNASLNHMGSGLFAKENIYQCNRIIYAYHVEISPRLQEYEKNHTIKDLQPDWILTQTPKNISTDSYMLAHYTIVDSIPGGEFDSIWCWRKKDIQTD